MARDEMPVEQLAIMVSEMSRSRVGGRQLIGPSGRVQVGRGGAESGYRGGWNSIVLAITIEAAIDQKT
jgi:hypothetical protein